MIKPRRGKGKSLAHKIVNHTAKGRIVPSITIRKKDMETLSNLIRKLL